MICFPNAKINLGLHIVSRRPDGYHNLETIFYPIGMRDALEIIPAGDPLDKPTEIPELSSAREVHAPLPECTAGIELTTQEGGSSVTYRFFQTGMPVDEAPENNMVIRALRLISAEKRIPATDIHLFKKIPTGAGLGGGSSDAAFMLRLLNDAYSLGYSNEDLMHLAAQLGADCPFFIRNIPSYATGTGNILEPVSVTLERYFIVLVKPEIPVSTKEAYAMITPQQPALSLKEIVKKPIHEWKTRMKNDFETPVFKKYPEICNIKQQMYDLGAVYAAMSGSGSAVYGLFEDEPAWQSAFDGYFVWTNSNSTPTH